MESVRFEVEGNPVPKGRPRAYRRGAFVGMYTPSKTAAFESLVAIAAQKNMASRAPFDSALSVNLIFHIAIPKSWTKKKTALAESGGVLHTAKPDLDNLIKSVTDAMNKIVYNDDSQIVELSARKVYSSRPKTEIFVKRCYFLKVFFDKNHCNYRLFMGIRTKFFIKEVNS